MSDKTELEWTDATWPAVTLMPRRDASGVRRYVRKRTDRPGVKERREQRARGLAWCRGHLEWLPLAEVHGGLCRDHANAEYRVQYAEGGGAIRQRVHARKRALDPIPGWRLADQRLAFAGRCAYGCNRPATTSDHVWPVALGGQSRPGNLVPACVHCNSRKRAADPALWVERGLSALPGPWGDLIALALEHGTDEWLEVA